MRHAAIFTAFAATLALQVPGSRAFVALAYAWTSIALAWIGVAYMRQAPAAFGKSADGQLPLSIRLLLLPYLLLQGLVFRLARRSTLPPSQVADGCFLGPRLLPGDVGFLDAHTLAAVLDLTCEFDEPAAIRAGRHYLCLPMLDATAPSRLQLDAAVAFLEAHPRAYVHCAQGHGRSATVVAAWLLASGRVESLAAALDWLRRVRPCARLNATQRQAVQVWLAARA